MNKLPLVALVGLLSFNASSFAATETDSFYKGKVGADMWWGSTKLNEVRKDDSSSPSLYFAFEHKFPMLPNASIRYTTIDSSDLAFDKYDYTFYYNVLDHDLMHFDAGITVTQYSGSKYIEPVNGGQSDFDELTWSFYGGAEINVPKTNIDFIGSMEFGDSKGIKSTDLMAGVQYRLPVVDSEVALRGGYRVIDLDSDEVFTSDAGKSFVMVDGWFMGAELRF